MINGNPGTTLLDAIDMTMEAAPWPTPTAVVLGNSLESYRAMKANMTSGERTAITSLPQMAEDVTLHAWPTPQAHDAKGAKTSEQIETQQVASLRSTRGGRPGCSNLNEVATIWSTPTHRDFRFPNSAESQERRNEDSKRAQQLPNQAAHLYPSAWSTPTAGDAELTGKPRPSREASGRTTDYLAVQATGTEPSGPSAPTEKRGGLSPKFVAFLMGYPPGYLACAPVENPKKGKGK